MIGSNVTRTQRAAWEAILEKCGEDVNPGKTPFAGPVWAHSRASRLAPHLAFPERSLAYLRLPNGQSALSAMPQREALPMVEAASGGVFAYGIAIVGQEIVDVVVGCAALYGVAVALGRGDKGSATTIARAHDLHIVKATVLGASWCFACVFWVLL